MLSYLSFRLPFHYWLASYMAATLYHLICRSSSEPFSCFGFLSLAVCASLYAWLAKGNPSCQHSCRRDMLYYTALLIAALYLAKLSDNFVEHLYSLNNSQGLSQDNRKWLVHVLAVFALIVEAESRIHPVSPRVSSSCCAPAKMLLADHSHSQRRSNCRLHILV